MKKNLSFYEFDSRQSWRDALLTRWRKRFDPSSFSVILAGGNTPRFFYESLAQEPLDWTGVDIFIGDERFVPPDHPESNFRMIHESLLNKIEIPENRIRRWKTELGTEIAADDYENQIQQLFKQKKVFDLALLGIGTDGHTASLFPETEALKENQRFAVANPVPQLKTTRFTLTYPCFRLVKEIWFLVSGSDKKPILERLKQRNCNLPAAHIQAIENTLFFIQTDSR